MSYLLIDSKCVAETSERLKSGEEVRISWLKTEGSLVNAVFAKASNAKKWGQSEKNPAPIDRVTLLSSNGVYKEFYAG